MEIQSHILQPSPTWQLIYKLSSLTLISLSIMYWNRFSSIRLTSTPIAVHTVWLTFLPNFAPKKLPTKKGPWKVFLVPSASFVSFMFHRLSEIGGPYQGVSPFSLPVILRIREACDEFFYNDEASTEIMVFFPFPEGYRRSSYFGFWFFACLITAYDLQFVGLIEVVQ